MRARILKTVTHNSVHITVAQPHAHSLCLSLRQLARLNSSPLTLAHPSNSLSPCDAFVGHAVVCCSGVLCVRSAAGRQHGPTCQEGHMLMRNSDDVVDHSRRERKTARPSALTSARLPHRSSSLLSAAQLNSACDCAGLSSGLGPATANGEQISTRRRTHGQGLALTTTYGPPCYATPAMPGPSRLPSRLFSCFGRQHVYLHRASSRGSTHSCALRSPVQVPTLPSHATPLQELWGLHLCSRSVLRTLLRHSSTSWEVGTPTTPAREENL